MAKKKLSNNWMKESLLDACERYGLKTGNDIDYLMEELEEYKSFFRNMSIFQERSKINE